MKLKDKHERVVVTPENPLHDVMNEPFRGESGKQTGQSMVDHLCIRLAYKAFEGDRRALVTSYKNAAAYEIKLAKAGRYNTGVAYNELNLEYEWLGDVAALLDIARPCAVPPRDMRHPYERNERSRLEKWVTPLARKRGLCSDEHLTNIGIWEAKGCEQWRYWWDFEVPIIFEPYNPETGKFTDMGFPSVPKECVGKPKRTIHPFDRKVRYPRNGKKTRMRLAEAIFRCARIYAANHPEDTKFAALVIDLDGQMQAAREKNGIVFEDHGPLQLGDGKLHAPFAVACLEDALIGMGAAEILYPYRKYARAVLKPWIVQPALDRMKKRSLTYSEQMRIVTRTLHPEQVNWPDWWEVDWFKKPACE
jgi:hypothetical protein